MPVGNKGSSLVNINPDAGVLVLEDSFTSILTQDAVEDVLTPISFGASRVSPNGLVAYSSTFNDLEILKGGDYAFKSRARAKRIGGNAGESELFLQAQFSIDNRATWVNTGNSVDVMIDNNKQVEVFFDVAFAEFPTGAIVREVFARSSEGTDFGSLVAGTPSAALQALGIEASPAAQLSVYRLKGYNYV